MYSSTTEAPVVLVGTAHVIDVAAALRVKLSDRGLQGIALELDAERAQQILAEPGATPGRGGGGPFFLRLWAAIQQRLGQELGAGVGAEMRAAAQLAHEWKVPLFLIDDPIRETLGRLVRSLTFKERISLLLGSIVGVFLPARLVEKQIGEYTESPEPLLEEMRSQFPTVTRVLLDERNEHMAARLAEIRGRGFGRVAAIVGDAHVVGLTEALHRRAIPVEAIRFSALAPPLGAGPSAETPG
ncbi:MAG TPA: TraB/GumN family protein [Thermoplasmata archaeon]|nr:TraB/GumN family protein [Thermoplasmata archaeon]